MNNAVPFFMVIVEILLYAALIISFFSLVFLIWNYIMSFNKKNYLKVSWIWLIFNVAFSLTNFILIILCFLNIFDPSYFGKNIYNEDTLIRIVKFNIIVLVLIIIYFFILIFCSKYFSIYQKDDKLVLFGSVFKTEKIKKIKEFKFGYIVFYSHKIQIFFKKTKVTNILETYTVF